MLVLRLAILIALAFLVALGGAYLATRNRKYLRWAGKTIQLMVLLAVAFGLFYLGERVFRLL